MSKKHEVVIIGAGAIGCSIAYHLAKKGITSTIIEKESIGARASGKAWAVVSYPPSLLGEALLPDSYMTMPEGETIDRWQDLYWSGYYRMSALALDIWEKGGVDIDFGAVPVTRIATSKEKETEYKQLMAYLEDAGYYEYDWLDSQDLNTIFPGINPKVRGD